MVTRTSKASEANLTLEDISFEHHVKVNLPNPKRRKISSVHWEASEMPTIPVLVNTERLEKHTRLIVFQAEARLKRQAPLDLEEDKEDQDKKKKQEDKENQEKKQENQKRD